MPIEAFSLTQENNTVSMQEKPKYKNLPTKDHRSLYPQILCIIDFSSEQIYLQSSYPITSYQLWNKEGESLIAAYTSDSQLVELMMELRGSYQLRLETDEYIYIGEIEL